MMELLRTALTLAASLGSGMMAGLFFVFSVAVMDALGRVPRAQGVLAMQSINQEILNPWFFTLFFGTGALGLLLSIIVLLDGRGAEVGYLIAATLLYIGGGIAVTIVRNVPLNDALAAADPASNETAALWSRYLDVWTRWNHIRTLACAAASILFMLAACEMFVTQDRGASQH
jgi:uncharacterized membrane protein